MLLLSPGPGHRVVRWQPSGTNLVLFQSDPMPHQPPEESVFSCTTDKEEDECP